MRRLVIALCLCAVVAEAGLLGELMRMRAVSVVSGSGLPTPVFLYNAEAPYTNAAGKVLDTSGSGNVGTLSSGIFTNIDGNGAIYSATQIGLATVGTNLADSASSWSISFWAKLTANSIAGSLFNKASTYNQGWVTRADGNWRFYGGAASSAFAAPGIPPTNTWIHFVASFSNVSASANDVLTVYTNGSVWLASTTFDGAPIQSNVVWMCPQNVGGILKGAYDGASVYTQALSSTQVLQLYQQGRP